MPARGRPWPRRGPSGPPRARAAAAAPRAASRPCVVGCAPPCPSTPLRGVTASLAADLWELADGDAVDHQSFWLELARELTAQEPTTSDWYQETVARCGESTSDALGRYFDATSSGLEYIYRKKLKDGAAGMDRQGLCSALVDHFGFSGERVRLESMKGVLDKAEGPDGLISRDSFAEVVRKLRIGALLVRNFAPELSVTAVYKSVHCDEDWSLKIMSFDGDDGVGHIDQQWFDLMAICTVPQAYAEDEYVESMTDFLFHSAHGQTSGKVQWLHVHRPETRLVLALGQRFHLRLSVMGMLLRIDEVPPQIDDLGKKASLGTSSWSSVVFPCVFLDDRSRRSLARYREWRALREQIARENSPSPRTRFLARRARSASRALAAADDEPTIFVGVIQVTQVLLWNGTPEEGEDVVTSLGTPKYLGFWLATLPKTWIEGGLLSNFASLLPCTRRAKLREGKKEAQKRVGGYTRLSQEDSDQTDDEMGDIERGVSGGKFTSHTLQRLSRETIDDMNQASADEIGLMRYQEEAEHQTNYGSFYRGVLQQLRETNSVLRMGNAFHLLVRIILDGTTEHTRVLELYEIAIAKCKTKLAERNARDGPELMTMISLAKMELKARWRILGSVQSFESAVLPTLRELSTSWRGTERQISLPARIIRHHMIDIDHNVAQVVRQCQCQIHICESLIDEYDRKAMDKSNNILNILTFITFLMVPLQILTGYYGMNFAHGLYGSKEKEGELYF
ncbi:unnamed protein product [Prorocentrum cordatum]|uniref:Uncharacterized protein n=2 Tax=Prorocentrum cordatum TaxID=2364126 RepID=A0ABN9YH60_9DINO|nr:unnamed protein product [Polarella glacialis]